MKPIRAHSDVHELYDVTFLYVNIHAPVEADEGTVERCKKALGKIKAQLDQLDELRNNPVEYRERAEQICGTIRVNLHKVYKRITGTSRY